ncbi:MAG: YjbH domain-containing protein [Chlamydiales bacterium]
MIVEEINQRLNDRFPTYYNHYLQGGYINMPSARMGDAGEIGFGYASVPPYGVYSGRLQLFDFLELSGSYRIFRGIQDPVLGTFGFGEFADKGMNAKFALLRPEDTDYVLPGISLGWDDFLGTKSFEAQYVVATQVFPKQGFELSLGYGGKRYNGLFGGILWTPWRHCHNSWFQGIAVNAEYDHTDYKRDPHPKGRSQFFPLNVGLKWRLAHYFDLSASYIRGKEFAFSLSAFYNFGETCGFVPKIHDPLPYKSPRNYQPIGWARPESVLICELYFHLRQQGFILNDVALSYDVDCNGTLYLTIYNCKWRTLWDVRSRLNDILAALTPADISKVIVVMESEGFPVQELHYHSAFLQGFACKEIGHTELNLLTPMREVSCLDPCRTRYLFAKRRELYHLNLRPDFLTFFGSAKGKFQYAVGLNLEIEGFITNRIYYDISLLYTLHTTLSGVSSTDRLNPSRLINVRTDLVRYLQKRDLRVERAYLQKTWNIGRGWYGRLSTGLFEDMYGGSAVELLYYPVNACWAVGAEGAILRKRTLTGVGFSDKIRKLEGFNPVFQNFRGRQYFLDLYYNWERASLDMKLSLGKFLANDSGGRFEIGKYFPSGLRFYFWYTITNGNDVVNGERYYDKGIAFSMPLDIFYTCTSRKRWGYGMSAWLRDVGYRAGTGKRLYEQIREERLRW